jgi:hypothetical protein
MILRLVLLTVFQIFRLLLLGRQLTIMTLEGGIHPNHREITLHEAMAIELIVALAGKETNVQTPMISKIISAGGSRIKPLLVVLTD